MKIIYKSIIQSNLNYCILAWGYNCGRLKTLQKKAIRIITNSKYNSHTTPLFKDLAILKIEDMFKLNMLKWYYLYENKKLPHYFMNFNVRKQHNIHNHNTRNRNDVTKPRTRIQAAKKSLRNHIPTIIGATSKEILDKIQTHSYHGFACYSKIKLLQEYSINCIIENCYICDR